MPRIEPAALPTDAPQSSLEQVLARVRASAARRDQSGEGLDEEIGWLRELGLLREALPSPLTTTATLLGPAAQSGLASLSDNPLALLSILRRIGAASLPLGRLFEGHVNTAQLIGQLAAPSLQRRCVAAVRGGALLGVWGADGAEPLTAQETATGFILSGAKSFCSGLGLVEIALVSASVDGRTRLFAVDVGDPARADQDQWHVSGMRASRSGGYDFSGMALPADSAVGGPDAYYAEPGFLGGMYRMCAVQIGGLDELLAQTAIALRARGKAGDSLAQLRVGRIAALRTLAVHVTQGVARRIIANAPADAIAREAVLMREGVEHCIVSALAIVERCLGTQVHRENTAVSRLRRDLSVYIRQAAVDERLMAVGSWYLAQGEEPER